MIHSKETNSNKKKQAESKYHYKNLYSNNKDVMDEVFEDKTNRAKAINDLSEHLPNCKIII